MSKIICDICGTTYPDTADCCPICGCSKDSAVELLGDSVEAEELQEGERASKGRFSGKKRREIFDYDEVNPQAHNNAVQEETTDDEDEVYEEGPKSNTFAVICLTVLIVALLLAAAYLGFRYILPNLNLGTPATEPQAVATEPPQTTGYSIPCQNIGLNSGKEALLTEEGAFFLIHVSPMPEDTTDELQYASADESIATVSEDGRITAVSEGRTVIYITCGSIQQTVDVIVRYEEDTVPPIEEETLPEDAGSDEETPEETENATEATEAVEEAGSSGIRTDVTLKLKKTDISLGKYYSFQLVLDCDLKPEDVEWSVEHPHIATVDETGMVTAKKSGTTAVHVKYGDQEVQCIIRVG